MIFHPVSFRFHTQQSKDVAKSIHICISLQIRLQPGSRRSTTATMSTTCRCGWWCEAWLPPLKVVENHGSYSSEKKISSKNFSLEFGVSGLSQHDEVQYETISKFFRILSHSPSTRFLGNVV